MAPAHQQHMARALHNHAAGNLGIEIDDEAAGRAGRARTAANLALAKRGSAARAEAHPPQLRIIWQIHHPSGANFKMNRRLL